METDDRAAEYLSTVSQRLGCDGFKVTFDVAFGAYDFRCVAHKREFGIQYLGWAGFSFSFADLRDLDMHGLRHFSLAAFEYAKKLRRIPLPYGFGEMVCCFPVAIVDGIEGAVVQQLRDSNPVKHWGNFVIPVIADVAARELHYSHTKPLRGNMYLDYLKGLIRDKLGPGW